MMYKTFYFIAIIFMYIIASLHDCTHIALLIYAMHAVTPKYIYVAFVEII